MPEFFFRHSGKGSVPATFGFPASDKDEAFRRKDEFVAKQGVKYVPGSMKIFEDNEWKKVPDPPKKAGTESNADSGWLNHKSIWDLTN